MHTRPLRLLCLSLPLWLAACGDAQPPAESAQLSPQEKLQREGRRTARRCAGCHGPEGVSRVDSYPSIAGLSREYLAEQLRAFRSGERDNPMMMSVARNLSDRDIEALSHYYAQLPGPGDE